MDKGINENINVGHIGLLDTTLMACAGVLFAAQAYPVGGTLLFGVLLRTAWRWHKSAIVDMADHALTDGAATYHAARQLPQRARRLRDRAAATVAEAGGRAVDEPSSGRPPDAASGGRQVDEPSSGLPNPNQVVQWLGAKHHLLLVGHTRGGKSVLLHALARHQAAQGVKTVVCDIDAIDGEYGYRVVGSGDDYASIAKALQLVEKEVAKRREQRKHGKRTFSQIWLLIDEAHDVVSELGCWSTLESVIRRGAKLGIHLCLATQDSQVKTLGLEGKSQLLVNLTRVECLNEAGRRVLQIDQIGSVQTPDLPSPDDTVTRVQPDRPTGKQTGDPLLASLLGVMDGITGGTDNAVTGLCEGDNASITGVMEAAHNGAHNGAHNAAHNAEITDGEIKQWVEEGVSKRKIAERLSGSMQARLARIDAVKKNAAG